MSILCKGSNLRCQSTDWLFISNVPNLFQEKTSSNKYIKIMDFKSFHETQKPLYQKFTKSSLMYRTCQNLKYQGTGSNKLSGYNKLKASKELIKIASKMKLSSGTLCPGKTKNKAEFEENLCGQFYSTIPISSKCKKIIVNSYKILQRGLTTKETSDWDSKKPNSFLSENKLFKKASQICPNFQGENYEKKSAKILLPQNDHIKNMQSPEAKENIQLTFKNLGSKFNLKKSSLEKNNPKLNIPKFRNLASKYDNAQINIHKIFDDISILGARKNYDSKKKPLPEVLNIEDKLKECLINIKDYNKKPRSFLNILNPSTHTLLIEEIKRRSEPLMSPLVKESHKNFINLMEEQGSIIKNMINENELSNKNSNQNLHKESSKYIGVSSILNLKRKKLNKIKV